MKRVAIIGTAGRKRMPEKRHARYMIEVARKFMAGRDGSTLVSGGAAWADHTAVLLAEQDGWPLTLHLPCTFDRVAAKFVGERGTPGATMNHWHRLYSLETFGCEEGSLRHIRRALTWDSTKVTEGGGFWMRNATVAESEVVLAFTFGESEPLDGGTRQTWDMAKARGAEIHHVGLT